MVLMQLGAKMGDCIKLAQLSQLLHPCPTTYHMLTKKPCSMELIGCLRVWDKDVGKERHRQKKATADFP